MTHHQIAIIGGGPAGIACAVQLYHAGLRPLLIEKDKLGGLLRSANWVENYPGFPDGIKGSDLAQLFAQQILHFEPELIYGEVTKIDWDGQQFNMDMSDRTMTAETLIIATGTMPKPLPAFCHKPELEGRIYSEIIPLIREKDQTIAIIGGGDAAFDYALSLTQANDVVIFSRSPQPKCLEVLRQRVDAHNTIRYYQNVRINGVALQSDTRIKIDYSEHRSKREMVADYILLAIGREPNVDLLSPDLIEKSKPLLENEKLILIGDVINEYKRQTAIAVGQGVMAAMQIMETIRKT